MASKKKVVSKDDLRRLMKETRGNIKKDAKKIDSPLAKYNSLGQLVCAVCNSQVKSELLWNAHLQGRTHKENVAALKAQAEAKNTPTVVPPSAAKRKAEGDVNSKSSKQARVSKNKNAQGLPEGFFDEGMAPKPLKGILKKPKLAGDYGSSSEEEDEATATGAAPAPGAPGSAPATVGSTNTGTLSSSLPADFFDPGVAPSSSVEGEGEEEKATHSMAEKLPEGFFDNPKEDAKVRKVEYKDKMDEEWEMFTRAMKEQSVISEAIVEEEEAEKMTERRIEEIDEQMHRWSRVDELHQKREAMLSREPERMDTGGDSDSDLDQQDFNDLLDWRSKKAWKS